MPSEPLSGVRVIDLTRFLAGPYCGSVLAGFGAEVVRVEPPAGFEDRGLVPIGARTGGALFQQANCNKKSIALETKGPEGRAILEQLVRTADVVLTNMPPPTLRRARLDHASLCAIRADLVTANVSAFGSKGPLAARSGFDGVGQAMSGAAYLAGSRSGPRRSAASYVDYATGLATALGVLAALIHRRNTGEGQEVESSLLGTALAFTNPWHIEEAVRGLHRRPFGNRSPNSAPSDLYRTRDGWIVVQVIGSAMFARWAGLVGRPDLAADPGLQGDAARGRRGAALSPLMSAWARERTTAGAIDELAERGIPAGPVLSPRQVVEDPALRESGVFQPLQLPGLEVDAPIAALPVALAGVASPVPRRAPGVGEHTREVLASLGIGPARIEALAAAGTIRLGDPA